LFTSILILYSERRLRANPLERPQLAARKDGARKKPRFIKKPAGTSESDAAQDGMDVDEESVGSLLNSNKRDREDGTGTANVLQFLSLLLITLQIQLLVTWKVIVSAGREKLYFLVSNVLVQADAS
jgi:hypothetical protein